MGKYQKIAIIGLLVSPFILLPLLPKETVASTHETIANNIPQVNNLMNYLSSENPDEKLYFNPSTKDIINLYKQGFNHNGGKVDVASDVKYGHSIPMTEEQIRKHDAVKKKMADDEKKKKDAEEAKKKAEEEEKKKKEEEEKKKKEEEERKEKEIQQKKEEEEKRIKEEKEKYEKEQAELLKLEEEKAEKEALAKEKAKIEKERLELEEEKKKLAKEEEEKKLATTNDADSA